MTDYIIILIYCLALIWKNNPVYLSTLCFHAKSNSNSMILSVSLSASEEDELRAVNRSAKRSKWRKSKGFRDCDR